MFLFLFKFIITYNPKKINLYIYDHVWYEDDMIIISIVYYDCNHYYYYDCIKVSTSVEPKGK